jgi:hypothetical protein
MVVETRKALKITILLAVAAMGIIVFYRWRTAGNAEIQVITQRIAIAIQSNDRDALLHDPVLAGHEGTVDWLLRFHPDLANGYRVSVLKNGDGYTLLEEDQRFRISARSNLQRRTCILDSSSITGRTRWVSLRPQERQEVRLQLSTPMPEIRNPIFLAPAVFSLQTGKNMQNQTNDSNLSVQFPPPSSSSALPGAGA